MTANTLLNSQEVRKLPAGALFKAIFVISYISQKSDKNGKPYYDVTATDGLRLREVYAPVDEGAARELAGLGEPRA